MARKKKQEVIEVGNTAGSHLTDNFVDEDYFPFSLKTLQFLQNFANSLDYNQAALEAGYQNSYIYKLIERPEVKKEMEVIYRKRFDAIGMDAQLTSGEHLRLQNKFESDYDKMDLNGKAKMASPLAKMSTESLRASGCFDPKGEIGGTNVQVNIKIGGEEGITIDGKTE